MCQMMYQFSIAAITNNQRLSWLKQYKFTGISYSFTNQLSDTDPTRLKSGCWQSWVPFCSLWVGSIAAHMLWFLAPLVSSNHQGWVKSFYITLSDFLLWLLLSGLGDFCDCIGTCWIIQNNFLVSRSADEQSSSICNLIFLFHVAWHIPRFQG